MPLPQEFRDLAKRVNNWGRWGDEDERGTLNLITPEVIARAAACIRTGKQFSLAIPLGPRGPQTGMIPGRVNPARTMTMINRPLTGDPADFCTSDDVVYMGLQAGTHWDSLAHASYEGKLYNGFAASSVDDKGAARCGIDKVGTVVSRAVLLDMAPGDRLAPGHAIRPADLDEAEQRAGTRLEAGDIVLLRTGHMQLLRADDRDSYGYGVATPGPAMAACEWFHERDVAAVATDNLAFEVFPFEYEDCVLPVHLLDLVEMGMIQGQNWDMEELAADCLADGVYEMFLSASPEPFARGLGGPVNPVAIK
jgi:kynurenine formamidase